MYEDNEEGIERLKQQLELVKRQDRILAEIETKLNQMKMMARYARDNKLSDIALAALNKKIRERERMIEVLKSKLVIIH